MNESTKAPSFKRTELSDNLRVINSRRSGVLLFVHVDDLDAIIIAAILAHTVSKLHLMALGAFNDPRSAQLPVRAAAVFACLGNFPLRNSHCYTSS